MAGVSISISESTEHNMYIAQLKEVFESCDETGTHKLNRRELLTLCDRLQLEEQSECFIKGLLGNKEEVDFEEFHVFFVDILSQTYDDAKEEATDEDEEDESDDESDTDDADDDIEDIDDKVVQVPVELDEDCNPVSREVSPKYELGAKRYGRRSIPVSVEELDLFAVLPIDEADREVASSSLKHALTLDLGSSSEDAYNHREASPDTPVLLSTVTAIVPGVSDDAE